MSIKEINKLFKPEGLFYLVSDYIYIYKYYIYIVLLLCFLFFFTIFLYIR